MNFIKNKKVCIFIIVIIFLHLFIKSYNYKEELGKYDHYTLDKLGSILEKLIIVGECDDFDENLFNDELIKINEISKCMQQSQRLSFLWMDIHANLISNYKNNTVTKKLEYAKTLETAINILLRDIGNYCNSLKYVSINSMNITYNFDVATYDYLNDRKNLIKFKRKIRKK